MRNVRIKRAWCCSISSTVARPLILWILQGKLQSQQEVCHMQWAAESPRYLQFPLDSMSRLQISETLTFLQTLRWRSILISLKCVDVSSQWIPGRSFEKKEHSMGIAAAAISPKFCRSPWKWFDLELAVTDKKLEKRSSGKNDKMLLKPNIRPITG